MIANVNNWENQTAGQESVLEVEHHASLFEQVWVEALPHAQQHTVQHSDQGTEQRQLRQKRILDLAICLLALPVALPIMGLVALAIKLDSKGDVIFQQERVGRHGKTFACLKFRSMKVNAEEIKAQLMQSNEASGPVFKMKRDPRITRVGRIIPQA